MIDTTGKSLQQVSDAIAGKLIRQGGQCLDEDGNCAYGDGKGNHCAIGWLLSETSPLMNSGHTLSGLVETNSLEQEPNREFIIGNVGALFLIQSLHDSLLNRSGRCEKIAIIHDLNMDAWSEWVEMGDS